MRIQHNIMAMNAYRNLSSNQSALAKNLEKLSSGFKINRAGDDAAGLAISEKMRAQITGLDAAQKNVKDGVSLVKTAEGAMQEIHDMLGRMKYLATQSANGTYDNDVDRRNLQKEVNSLLSEIDRIADSANFNGQKLMDGSLDASVQSRSMVNDTIVADLLGTTQGTRLHRDGPDLTGAGTSFSVSLGDIKWKTSSSGTSGVDSLKISIGTGTSKIEINMAHNKRKADNSFNNKTVTASKIAKQLVKASHGKFKGAAIGSSSDGINIKIGDTTLATTAIQNAGSTVTITHAKFGKIKITADGNRLVFNQLEAPKTTGGFLDGNASVKISGTGEFTLDENKMTYDKKTVNVSTVDPGKPMLNASTQIKFDLDMIKLGNSVTIGKETYTFVEKASKKGDVEIGDLIKKRDAALKVQGANIKDVNDKFVTESLEALSQAAKDNATWDVSAAHGADGIVMLTERAGQFKPGTTDGGFDFRSLDEVKKSIQFNSVASPDNVLRLQIGDTADSYNQLKVNINDLHTKALGISGLDISSQASAQNAIQNISDAINSVSATRGDLGAIQNRLEHTQNNLGVMRESIQEAESAIRDVDIADEMMKYTKNNILIQSAQAMLAQANQIPQGVLQLLQ